MAKISEIVTYVEDQEPNYSGFVVIGAGLPRTGTMSLRAALGQLLDGKCYHMLEVAAGDESQQDFWEKVMKNNGDIPRNEWVQFLQGKGYRAGCDFPISLFYK